MAKVLHQKSKATTQVIELSPTGPSIENTLVLSVSPIKWTWGLWYFCTIHIRLGEFCTLHHGLELRHLLQRPITLSGLGLIICH